MKKLYLLFFVVFTYSRVCAQDFTWVKGSSVNSDPAVYGTMGVPAPANTPGGRHGAAHWVDLSGNLWLFGGEGPYHDWWNDLWKYNVSTNEWTWIRGANTPSSVAIFGTQGVSSPNNEPGAREFANCWTDASGNFWMFGGDGFAAIVTNNGQQRLGDLWKYNPTTNEWTYMNGFTTVTQNGIYGTVGVPATTNAPGCRFGSCTWTDNNGNLWMFGGHGLAVTGADAYLNDLWKYNIASNEWTWVGGTNTFNQNAVYGTLGVPANTNIPGAKYFSVGWVDMPGNFYLCGGTGFNGSGFLGRQNELWKYNPTANTWTWINGSQNIPTPSAYGTQNIPSPSNVIGGREGSAGWKDVFGNFWVFGGDGAAMVNNTLTGGTLNDLFKYDPTSNQWTWMKGATVTEQHGTYGTLGVSAPTNVPGAREFSTYWTTPKKLWLFGGLGFDISSTNASERLGDLWSFRIPCNPDSVVANPGKIICSGNSATLTAVNGGSTTVWYNSPVSTTSLSGGTVLSISSLTTAGTSTVYSYYAEANSCSVMPRASISITVMLCAGISKISDPDYGFSFYPNPNSGEFKMENRNDFTQARLNIFNELGQKVFSEMLYSEQSVIKTGLTKGLYYYSMSIDDCKNVTGKLVIE